MRLVTTRLLTPTTTATGGDGIDSPTVDVADTTGFTNTGSFILGGTNVTYSDTTGTSFTGCSAHAATVGGELISSVATPYDPFVFLVFPSIQRRTKYRLAPPILRHPARPEMRLLVSATMMRRARVRRVLTSRLGRPLNTQIYPPIPVAVKHRLGKGAGW